MTSHQVSVAAESFAATLLAQSSYNVSVQYGANQPDYDLIAEGSGALAKISVKGSQNGGWALAISKKYKNKKNTYYDAIDNWLEHQRADVIFIFIQFLRVQIGASPRAYIATAQEVARQMKVQRQGRGHLALFEDYRREHPKSKFTDRIPNEWSFSKDRADKLIRLCRLVG